MLYGGFDITKIVAVFHALEVEDLLPDDVNEEEEWLDLAQVRVEDLESRPEPRLIVPVVVI